ncbi:MAG: hypothetical protein IRZ16_02750 [Myxococcaceae bacterium]|nr:hypothetical protein [Myxococcaceae bacterium]
MPLFFFREPEHHGEVNRASPWELLQQAVRGLLEPRLFFFTVAFAGFWLMFYQLFDILPNFIDDWVDSRAPAAFLAGLLGAQAVPTINGGNLTQEWIINFNARLISLFAFTVGYVTGKIRSLTAIVVGIALSAVAIYALGMSMSGWWILGAIGLFSIGEMTASPTKMRYLASIAPPGKEGLYMGYVNMTVGIGWSIGSIVAGEWYQRHGDKVELAKRYLVEKAGVPKGTVGALQKTEVLPFFEKHLGVDAWGARQLLWDHFDPAGMWLMFTAIGVAAGIAILGYDRLCRAADARPDHSFNLRGHLWVRALLVPIVGALLVGCWFRPSLALGIQAGMFALLLVASFFPERRPGPAGDAPPELAA